MRKTHIKSRRLIKLICFLLVVNIGSAISHPNLDPVNLKISTNAQRVKVGEEFEIRVDAGLSVKNENPPTEEMKLMIGTPKGFQQTGGTFQDMMSMQLTKAKPAASYVVKGKFTSSSTNGQFLLLKGNQTASSKNDYAMVGSLNVSVTSEGNEPAATSNKIMPPVAQGYVAYMSLSQFRASRSDTASVIYLNEGVKSGMFQYDPTDKVTPDDSSLVLVKNGKRFKREDIGYIRPEWFGANPNDELDDGPAIQKALNKANIQGLHIMFSPGIYFTSIGLKLKCADPKGVYPYKLTISGAGETRSSIKGMKGIEGQDLLYIDQSFPGPNDAQRNNYITIKDITLNANGAKSCFWASYVNGIKFQNILFFRGEEYCVKIGTYGKKECWSIYFNTCYFNGTMMNGKSNTGLLLLHQTRMVVVDQMESDGGKYSIDLYGSDKATIVNCKLEGAKTAAIYIHGSYGGEHKIANNLLNPYVGGDLRLFDGTISGIDIKGGVRNSISNNQILSPLLKGDDNHSYGIRVAQSGENVITGNTILLNPEYGIALYAENSVVTSNWIAATKYGIYTTGRSLISGNLISAPKEVAIQQANKNVVATSDNLILGGGLVNITPAGGPAGKPADASGQDIANMVNDGKTKKDVTASSLPVYNDNAAAKAAGLVNGAIYRTPTGELRVKY